MSTNDDRPTARLGDIEFEFEHPQLSSVGEGSAIHHQIIPIEENQDVGTVIQPFGRQAREWTLQGDCYKSTATALDNIIGEVVSLRHSRHSGEVYVRSVDTSPQGAEDQTGWRYEYRADLTEIL